MKDSDQAYIFEIQRMSTEDGPGIRTTVFFKECPLRCVWCHNPESIFHKASIQWYKIKCIGCKSCIDVCPEHALELTQQGMKIDRAKCKVCGQCVDACPSTAMRKLGHYISLDDLLEEIEKDTAYYIKSGGGITASGGEAAMQTDFLLKFFKKCRERSIHTALDLCGALPYAKYEALIPYTDLYLYDIKEIDPLKHKEFTGMANDLILKNLEMLLEQVPKVRSTAEFWIRTPVIPNFTATEENIHGIGTYIRERLKNKVQRWDLLAYNNLAADKYKRMDLEYKCRDLGLFTKEEMDNFLEIAKVEINKDPRGKHMIITATGLMKQSENGNSSKTNEKNQLKPSTGCG
jgi:pyruvate formate lyase activating enzyme